MVVWKSNGAQVATPAAEAVKYSAGEPAGYVASRRDG